MRLIIRLIKWIGIIFLVVLANFLIVEYLLRVNGIIENIQESKLNIELKSADYIIDFSPGIKERLLGLQLEDKFVSKSQEKENRISYDDVKKYNPYPPILHLFKSDYVIYCKNSATKQITIISGESDATPSILVDKGRGEYKGGGDYFVTYIFYQSYDNVNHQAISVDYDNIDWYSFRGGSYNGFEEAWFIALSFFQILILIIYSFINKRKTSKNTYIVSK